MYTIKIFLLQQKIAGKNIEQNGPCTGNMVFTENFSGIGRAV
jgi:hypothetical protein